MEGGLHALYCHHTQPDVLPAHGVQGRKKMLFNGGADFVGGPTYIGGSGGMLPQEMFLSVL